MQRDFDPLELARIVRPTEASRITGVSEKTLANYRWMQIGPRWIRMSRRAVGYRLRDLLDWLVEKEV